MSLKYATLARIPTEEDDEFLHEQLVSGSKVLIVQLENGKERKFTIPNGARSYELRVIGVCVIGKFFDGDNHPIPDSEFSL